MISEDKDFTPLSVVAKIKDPY